MLHGNPKDLDMMASTYSNRFSRLMIEADAFEPVKLEVKFDETKLLRTFAYDAGLYNPHIPRDIPRAFRAILILHCRTADR
eukprot:scaffold47503_cov20-Prasinocladus_malaysianus.AAC.1